MSLWYKRQYRRSVNGWVLASLLIRILIPLGFMPGNALAGEWLVPCPSAMPASVFESLEQAHHSHHHHHGSSDDAPAGDLLGAERQCPIGLALSAGMSIAPDVEATIAPFQGTHTSWHPAATHTAPAPRRYLSRAPPA